VLYREVEEKMEKVTQESLEVLLKGLQREEGSLGISFHEGSWELGVTFGKEAEDSDMCAGASYSVDDKLSNALAKIVEETGWKNVVGPQEGS
jgi:hypothetical protein